MNLDMIPTLSQEAMAAARLRIDNLTKPCYSLARLETIAEQLAGIRDDKQPSNLSMGLLLVAADHGVDCAENTSHGQQSLDWVVQFEEGRTAIQGAAKQIGASLRLVDIGLERPTGDVSHIESRKVMSGSHSWEQQSPAMTEQEFDAAWSHGLALADEMHEQGLEVVGLGNIGERTERDALVVTALLTGTPLEALLGESMSPRGIEEEAVRIHTYIDTFEVGGKQLLAGQEYIGSLEAFVDSHNYAKGTSPLAYYDNRTLWKEGYHTLTPDQVASILQSFAGPDIVALAAYIMRAASYRMAIVFDNGLTGAAVLAAFALNARIRDYVFPSASYDDLVHQAQLKHLQLTPYLFYNLQVAEGVGSAMGLSIIRAALHMLNDMKTFVEAEVEAAEDGPGNSHQENPSEFDVRKQHGEK